MSTPPKPRMCEHVNCTNGPDGKRAPIPKAGTSREQRRKYCCHKCGQLQNRIYAKESKREKRLESHPHKGVRECLYCDKSFMSLWYGDRKCPACKEREAEHEARRGRYEGPDL